MKKKSIDEMTEEELKQLVWGSSEGAAVIERRAVVPEKIQKRRKHFVMLPMEWYSRLHGATGHTYRIAWHLLYMHWKNKGEPIKLGNGMLEFDGVSRYSKWRALNDLERRGLISVERRPNRAPIVRLNL